MAGTTKSCTSCSDISRQIQELKQELQRMRKDQESANFKLMQNFNALSSALGLGALKGATLAATIAAIASGVSGILAIVSFWANGAYFSKLVKLAEETRKLGNDNLYANTVISNRTKEIQDRQLQYQLELEQQIGQFEYNQNVSNLKFDTLLTGITDFNGKFGRATAENFRVIQQEILKLPKQIPQFVREGLSDLRQQIPQYVREGLSDLQREIKLIPEKVANSPTIKNIPNTIRDTTREIVREVAKVPDRIGNTVNQTIYTPLSTTIKQIPQTIETQIRKITFQTTQPPKTTPTTSPQSPQLNEMEKLLRQINSNINPLLLIPASVKGLDQKINNLGGQIATLPNTPAFQNAVSTGVCNSGCIKGLGSGQGALNNKLDKLDNTLGAANAAMNATQMGLLNTINTKLGPQVTGGISGAIDTLSTKVGTLFSKTWNFFQMDRVINILTLVSSLITARQVTVDLAQLFFEVTGTVIQAMQSVIPEFLRDPEGKPMDLDLEQFFTQQIELLLIRLLGADNYKASRITWIKLNRVLTSAANVLDASRSAAQAIGNGLEVTAGLVGRFSNAAIREGLISEDSMPWSSERYEFNRYGAIGNYLNQVENLEEALDTVQQLAQIPITFVQSYTEATEATTELLKAVEGGEIAQTEEQRIDKLLTENGLGKTESELLNDS